MSADDQASALLYKAVGSRIAGLRQAAGMSQREFARYLDVKQNYIWRVEDGQQNLSLRNLARIAAGLRVPIADLLVGIDVDMAGDATRPWQRKSDASSDAHSDET